MSDVDEEQPPSSPMTKKIRSLPPDIVVEVGTGEAMRQFDCYKAALCFASPVFDLMFSNDMAENNDDRVRLPEKDPGEFKLFYSFIEHTGRVNSDNALTLAPWFHEFQMKRYLEECDEMLEGSITDYTRRDFYIHGENKNREEYFASILGQLQFAVRFDLDDTISAIDVLIADIAKAGCETIDLFTVQHVRTLVEHCFPLEKKKVRRFGEGAEASDGVYRIASNGNCRLFWKYLTTSSCVTGQTDFVEDYELANMTAEELAENKMLPLLVHSHMNRTAEKMKSRAAVKLIKSLHTDVPEAVHDRLEFKTDITADKAKAEALGALRTHFKTNKGDFEKLGMKKIPKSQRLKVVARLSTNSSVSSTGAVADATWTNRHRGTRLSL
mmetsp:Transcript_8801/g.18882  ORF Transcript_8801/g.18882 Transcript_8801/m.18882 type:complete len:383 (+) Transcript_8801:145-1293(+)